LVHNIETTTMITPQFEIKVALLGYVSVGKTTVLNALFRDKFSEVSMRRTTAGINYFRIVSQGSNTMKTKQQQQSSAVSDQEPQTAESVLHEIEASNQVLREANRVEEKGFTIELEKNLCEMREDTSLVIVDIPGINEANRESIFKDYAKHKWDTFDCVVVVMDARQGANTAEQIELLEFVNQNLKEKKNLPVIILGNKVDDPDSEELAVLVHELSEKISKVFEVGERGEALEAVLQASSKSRWFSSDCKKLPVFIPTSANHAFFYRTASLMSLENFKKFNKELIDQIGRDEFGRYRWKGMTEMEKLAEVFKAVTDPVKYEERLSTTNFDKFLAVLAYFVGGADVQLNLLRAQIDTKIKSLEYGPDLSRQLQLICDMSKTCMKDLGPLKKAFWCIYSNCEHMALENFRTGLRVEELKAPLNALFGYASVRSLGGAPDEKERVLKHAKALLRRQLAIIVKKNNIWHNEETDWEEPFRTREKDAANKTCKYCRATTKGAVEEAAGKAANLTWGKLTPHDWLTIMDSILLMAYNKQFCEKF
jgi:small GTP-binding protein